MRQLISRPTVFLVIGIGVFALLVSRFRTTEDQSRPVVSQLDPFESLGNLSGKNLAVASPSPVEPLPAHEPMVRDVITAPETYLQTAAVPLRDAPDTATDADLDADTGAEITAVVDAPDALVAPGVDIEIAAASEADSEVLLSNLDVVEVPVPVVDQINPVEDDLTVMEFEDAMDADVDVAEERYQLDDFGAEPNPNITPIVLMDEPQTSMPVVKSAVQPARAQVSETFRPQGWKKNPYITDSKDVVESTPAKAAPEIETSSLESAPTLDNLPRENQEALISAAMNASEEVSTVANFESQTAASTVSSIPTSGQPMRSVVAPSGEYADALPIVIGLPDSVAHKAVHNIEYGKSLSRRGAAFAARQEFYSSLRILAQAHDTQAGGTGYTHALRDGIIALKEAEDFIVSDTETQIGLRVANVIEGHSTKVISPAEAGGMTAIGAMQRYFAWASGQLRVASGQNVVAAEALYCLGKLHTVQAKFGANATKLDIAKAIVFHQAAMAADSSNFRSANELGVLMANSGRLQESQLMLKRSLQIRQLPQAWQNLAVIHQRSGQHRLAQLAHQESLISSRQQTASMASNTIRWVEPGAFNQGTPLQMRQQTADHRQAQPPVPQPQTNKPTIGQRLKSIF